MPIAIAVIICIVSFLLFLYLCGLVFALAYEAKINKIFRKMKEETRSLENLKLSMAMIHLKTYKITQDYQKKISEMEKTRQFILEKWLFLKKSTLKIEYRNIC